MRNNTDARQQCFKEEDAMLMPICYSLVPSTRHQAVVLNFAAALLQHIEIHKLGRVLHAPCNVMLSGKTVIQPDILFVEKKRRGIIGDNYLRGAPDLIVEVVSRKVGTADTLAKKKICARFQVPEYWAVDLDNTTVETLLWSELGYVSAGRYRNSDRLASPLLPELNLPLSRIFRNARS
jgi:Uma2 family endonuclease